MNGRDCLLEASAKFACAGKSFQKVDLAQDICMVHIEAALFQAVDGNLMGKGRVGQYYAGLLQPKVGVLVVHVGGELLDLNVGPFDLLLGAAKLEKEFYIQGQARASEGEPHTQCQ